MNEDELQLKYAEGFLDALNWVKKQVDNLESVDQYEWVTGMKLVASNVDEMVVRVTNNIQEHKKDCNIES